MKTFGVQIAAMIAATLVAGVACAVVAQVLDVPDVLRATACAVLASLIVGTAAVTLLTAFGAAPPAILLVTGVRISLTLGLGFVLAKGIEGLWSPVFFVTLGVIYLANLAVETWFLYRACLSGGTVHQPGPFPAASEKVAC
ncbi:hypothetical protein [Planctomicrobium sp. SH664]|uniref:hypothetical protein n=1 Tax=Planctomicrobium sp. SH664 TaxID=3448125 RepID=UPI003F5CA0BB